MMGWVGCISGIRLTVRGKSTNVKYIELGCAECQGQDHLVQPRPSGGPLDLMSPDNDDNNDNNDDVKDLVMLIIMMVMRVMLVITLLVVVVVLMRLVAFSGRTDGSRLQSACQKIFFVIVLQ